MGFMLAIVSMNSYADTVDAPRRVILDKVVAVIGSSSILMSEVTTYAKQLDLQQRHEGYTSDKEQMTQAMEGLMTQRLLATQARIDSVDVNLSDISVRVEQQIEMMRDEAGGVVELEKQQNMEIFNIRDVLRRRLEEQAYAQGMQMDVIRDITVVPGEVERYYKSSDRDPLAMIGEQYRYAQITRFPASMEDAKRRVKERLLEMRERVINGTIKFSSLAQMYSVDPGSAYRGGEMEPQPSSAFVPEFAEALESLNPGQVSEVIETQFGFHIIELINRKGTIYHCRHILLRPTYTTEELMEPINFLDSLANVIRLDSISFERAAQLYSDDAPSKMNGGVVTNHDLLERYNANDAKMTVTKFLKEDFGARGYKSLDDFTELSKLKVGEVSPAFATEDMIGNNLSKIVKLVEVYPAHQASLAEDYIHIEGLALVDKQNRVFGEWLNKCIDATYIYIDPDMRSMKFENPRWVK